MQGNENLADSFEDADGDRTMVLIVLLCHVDKLIP
jgi:hypothetical protein